MLAHQSGTASQDGCAASLGPDSEARLVFKLFRLLNGIAIGNGARHDRLAERMLGAQLGGCCRRKELSLRDAIQGKHPLRLGPAKSEGTGLVENHGPHTAECLQV